VLTIAIMVTGTLWREQRVVNGAGDGSPRHAW
jgi:hypothetical protein